MGNKKKSPNTQKPVKRKSGKINLKPGDNSKYLKHALTAYKMPKIDTGDINQVYERTDWYLEQCVKDDMRPGVVGLCTALGITRMSLYNWQTGVHHGREHQEYALRIKTIIEQTMEAYMVEGKIHPTAGIFLMKNNHGYTNEQELTINTPTIGGQKELGEIEEKYIDSVVETVEDFKVE